VTVWRRRFAACSGELWRSVPAVAGPGRRPASHRQWPDRTRLAAEDLRNARGCSQSGWSADARTCGKLIPNSPGISICNENPHGRGLCTGYCRFDRRVIALDGDTVRRSAIPGFQMAFARTESVSHVAPLVTREHRHSLQYSPLRRAAASVSFSHIESFTRSSNFRALLGQHTMLKSDATVLSTSCDECRSLGSGHGRTLGCRVCRVMTTASPATRVSGSITVEERHIMLSASPSGHRPYPKLASRSASGAALLAALASICSHTAFAQMEPLNAAARMTDMAAAAPAAAARRRPGGTESELHAHSPNHVLTAGGLATPFQLVATRPRWRTVQRGQYGAIRLRGGSRLQSGQ